MLFWIFMFIMSLATPVSMLIIGIKFKKNPPQKIANSFGYRTSLSMKNSDTWHFAHQHFGMTLVPVATVITAITIPLMISMFNDDIVVIGIYGGIIVTIQCIILALTAIPTQRALKRTFDSFGNRISK